MRIWITRAQPEAAATAERLRRLGLEPVVEPVLEVRAADEAPSLDGVCALAFTSRNGVRAFAALVPERGLPVFAVGDATARAAREAGFAEVSSASGDVAALAGLIASRRDALLGGAVLHVAPEEPAGDLKGELERRGLSARGAVVYCTAPAGLAAGPPADVDAVLIHSAKAGLRLAQDPSVRAAAPGMVAICISDAAAEPLHGLGFSEVLVAALPSEASMLEVLDGWARRQAPARLFTPLFWVMIGFGLVCITLAILVATIGPRIHVSASNGSRAPAAQPLQFRGKSG